jgi:hypothetical protein
VAYINGKKLTKNYKVSFDRRFIKTCSTVIQEDPCPNQGEVRSSGKDPWGSSQKNSTCVIIRPFCSFFLFLFFFFVTFFLQMILLNIRYPQVLNAHRWCRGIPVDLLDSVQDSKDGLLSCPAARYVEPRAARFTPEQMKNKLSLSLSYMHLLNYFQNVVSIHSICN